MEATVNTRIFTDTPNMCKITKQGILHFYWLDCPDFYWLIKIISLGKKGSMQVWCLSSAVTTEISFIMFLSLLSVQNIDVSKANEN